MAYRLDTDLEFLGQLNSEDLNDLVSCITAKGSIQSKNIFARLSKKITKNITQKRSSLITSKLYEQYYPDHKKYWSLIAEEVQMLGANSIISFFRGCGVEYKEILRDVCKKMNVEYKKNLTVEVAEEKFLKKILKDYLDILKPKDLKKMAYQLGINDEGEIKKSTVIKIFLTVFKAGSFESYRVVVTTFNSMVKLIFNKGLIFITNAVIIKKAASIFTGPLGLSIAGIWTAFDIAGPAYRITIPAVIYISALRKLYKKNKPFYKNQS